MPYCQSFGRTPQPVSVAGLLVVVAVPVWPKFRLLPVRAAHVSCEPVVVGLCALKFNRSQSTTLSPSVSVQLRVPPATPVAVRIELTTRLAGLLTVNRPSLVADTR